MFVVEVKAISLVHIVQATADPKTHFFRQYVQLKRSTVDCYDFESGEIHKPLVKRFTPNGSRSWGHVLRSTEGLEKVAQQRTLTDLLKNFPVGGKTFR